MSLISGLRLIFIVCNLGNERFGAERNVTDALATPRFLWRGGAEADASHQRGKLLVVQTHFSFLMKVCRAIREAPAGSVSATRRDD